MLYEPNDKHKNPWQPGRKGSLCPRDLDEAARDVLLQKSLADPAGSRKRYATDGERAFCAQEHEPGRFHGYPVGWKEVPETIRNTWISEGLVRRAVIRKYWDDIGDRE